MSKTNAWLSFSSGKDSAWALHRLLSRDDVRVSGLFTTVNEAFERVAMHAVRRELLVRQAAAARLPLHVVDIPSPCSNEIYEERMGRLVERARADGVETMAFGDLYLEDIRAYREDRLSGTGIAPLFPLWGEPTYELARAMIRGGLVAHLTCVDPRKLPPSFAGRRFDEELLAELPESVDPCGENGEFHTFVSAGPMFAEPIPIALGAVVERDGFVFADVVPA